MNTQKTRTGMIVALAVLTLSTGMAELANAKDLPGRPPNGSACRGPAITGIAGVAIKQSSAKQMARGHWRTKVKLKAGIFYTNWDASSKAGGHYHCVKKAGTWRCSAHGYPCSMAAGTGS